MLTIDIKPLVDKKYNNVTQFAKAIGISTQNARKIYDGETSRIAFDLLEKICQVLECTPNDIFSFDGIHLHDNDAPPVYFHYDDTSMQYNRLREYVYKLVDKTIDEKLQNLNISINSTKKDSPE